MSSTPRLAYDAPSPRHPPAAPRPVERGRRRLWIFVPVFLLGTAVALAYGLLRTPQYETRALVEIHVSAQGTDLPGEGSQSSLPTQVQTLLSRPILEQVVLNLGGSPDLVAYGDPVAGLQRMLGAAAIEGTDLVEIRAKGPDPRLLPLVVNTLIDVYADRWRDRRHDRGENTQTALRLRTADLKDRIAHQRAAIEAFQARHDIESLRAENNRVLSRLGGLNAALDKAEEEVRAARARLSSVQASVGEGKPILTDTDRGAVANLDRKIQDIEAELDAIAEVYTPRYMALDPKVRDLRERLRDLRERRQALYLEAQENALAIARQDLDRARDHLRRIREDRALHKDRARVFEARFEELEGRKKELAQLEELYRRTREQQVQLGLEKAADLTRIEIVERAAAPLRVATPNLSRDTLLGLGGALLLALAAVLLFEFLTSAPAPHGAPGAGAISVRERDFPPLAADWSRRDGLELPSEYSVDGEWSGQGPERLPMSGGRLQRLPREIDPETLQRLWLHADDEARLTMGLLLCGVGVAELPQLRWEDLDPEQGRLHLPDRSLALPPALTTLVHDLAAAAGRGPLLTSHDGRPLDTEELNGLLVCAATDAGIPDPLGLDAELLRGTYIAYLIGTGLRLRDLPQVVGRLPARELAGYAHLSPSGEGRPLQAVNPVHPLLRQAPT
jgi:succinoglycan biosynthesis transport protein ExoP